MHKFSLFSLGELLKKALAYYRHSKEDSQEYSIPLQRERVRKFAKENHIEIIHEEEDERTGLTADRPGFQNILQHWVLDERAPHIDYILVTDVDRWARFQNPNEWGYYEFLCNQRGIQVVDISQGIPQGDHPLATNLITVLKREMSADFSRKLSDRVFHGCVNVSQQGYSAGGMPCYGMARMLLDENKKRVRILKRGERKQIANERVIFVPLGDETTKAVEETFRLFTEKECSFSDIAAVLNVRGSRSARGGVWDQKKIIHTLTNEIYTGTRMYNKTWQRLRGKRRNNPRSEWVMRRGAFDAVVSRETFDAAQRRLWSMLRTQRRDEEWVMEKARVMILHAATAFLSEHGVDEDDAFELCHNFPAVLSISNQIGDVKEWCFTIPEDLRTYPWVIGVGIVSNRANPVDEWFVIPAGYFGIGGVCAFTEKGKMHASCAVTTDQLTQKILELAKKQRPVRREEMEPVLL